MKASLTTAAVLAAATFAVADTIVLNNGDTLNGTIGQVTAKAIEFTSPALGKIVIPTENISKYTIDQPVRVRPKDAPVVTGKVSGDASSAKVGDRSYALGDLTYINPPAQEWSGALIGNFSLARGNTNKFTVGAEAAAGLRRDDETNNDRFTLGAAYNFGRTGGGPGGADVVTDTDNWRVGGQYDNFWTSQMYGYANVKLEHDAVSNLHYRLTPGVGIGYQWIENATTGFRTEAGLSYVREVYDLDDGSEDTNDNIAVRLAYHLDHALSDTTKLFHNVEIVPAIEDPGDYNLTADLGLKFKITGNFIGQVKVEYRRDSTPAAGSLKNDLLYLVGVGWQF